MRSMLLLGVLGPLVVLQAVDAWRTYSAARSAITVAYDRTLLASAKVIGESLVLVGDGAAARVAASVPYSALEAFEADTRTRMHHRVSGLQGELVTGSPSMPMARDTKLANPGPYAALVDFYDAHMDGDAVRVATLLQPVANDQTQGVARVQVAETLDLRAAAARELLIETLLRQALLLALVAGIVVWVVQRATRSLRDARDAIVASEEIKALPSTDAPRELAPLLDAINGLVARVQQFGEAQRRFVRDASHQLKTPLAVMKVQVQAAQRGDIATADAIAELSLTVERATALTNQMLALAKVEQLRQQEDNAPLTRWDEAVRAMCIELAPLAIEKHIDLSVELAAASVRAHEWSLREITRNLLANALAHTPESGSVRVSLQSDAAVGILRIEDTGPGIDESQRDRLFKPFSKGSTRSEGSGLGLAICADLVSHLRGAISLENRGGNTPTKGLRASVRLPVEVS
jgi:two-component system, OmpR family, sensor histidine kinase TctE